MLNLIQLTDLIIRPTLHELQEYSEEAVQLLIFTCEMESLAGTNLKSKIGTGLGIYNMTPERYNDIWQNYLLHQHQLSFILGTCFNVWRLESEERLIWDLRFATVFAMFHYMRSHEDYPPKNDSNAIYDYYQKYYVLSPFYNQNSHQESDHIAMPY